MVIRVEYYIPKRYFIKHKQKIKKILYKHDFEVSYLKFVLMMSDREVAKHLGVSVFRIRKKLSFCCDKLRKSGFEFFTLT
jgi:DNA-directed RNA polymerase specialized sigma subunit